MNDKNFTQFPFLTREMLKFGNTSKIELVLTSIASRKLELTVKGITKSGVINIKQETNDNSYPTSEVSQIDDIPIMVGIEASENELAHGEIYVSLSLKIDDQIVFNFVSGFITTAKGLSWPNSNLNDSVPNRGFFTKAEGLTPAAGAEGYIVVPLGEIWKILSVYTRLVTDANVANRRIHLIFTGDRIADRRSLSTINITANVAKKYYFDLYGTGTSIDHYGSLLSNLPAEMWLSAGNRITTETVALQAGDQIDKLEVSIEKFFTGSSF